MGEMDKKETGIQEDKARTKTSEKEFFLFLLAMLVPIGLIYLTYIMPKIKNRHGKESEQKYTISPVNPSSFGEGITGPITYTVDSSDYVNWTYFDFSQGSVVEVRDENKDPWDIKIQRLRILFNQNRNRPPKEGLGKHQLPETRDPAYGIKLLGAGGLENYKEVPEGKFHREISEVGKWYNYEWLPTYLFPHDLTYGIHTSDDKYVLFKMLSYYCNGETMGCMTFEFIYQGDGSNRF